MECRGWSAAVDAHVVRTRGRSGGERALQIWGWRSFLLLSPPGRPHHSHCDWCSPGVTGHGLLRAAWLVHLCRRAGEVWGHRDGHQVGQGGQRPEPVVASRDSPHSPAVALRQSLHTPRARQSAA